VHPDLTARRSGAWSYECEDCVLFALEAEGRGSALARWLGEVALLEKAALRDSTHATYATGQGAYRRFCEEELGLPERAFFPAGSGVRAAVPAELVRCFVAHEWRRGLKVSTIENYVEHVAAREREFLVPLTAMGTRAPAVKRVLRGVSRSAEREGRAEVRQAAAVTEELLQLLLSDLWGGAVTSSKGKLPLEPRWCFQTIAWLTLGTAGLLRRSELVALRISDFSFENGIIAVRVRKSKTSGLPVTVEVSASAFGVELDRVVQTLIEACRQDGLGEEDFLLRNSLDARKPYAADGGAIAEALKRLVEQTARRHGLRGVHGKDFSGHSLRRGGAQILRDRGVPRDLVKAQGRWRSDAVDVYFSTVCAETRQAVARVFSASGRRHGWRHAR
jgi:integrase